MTGHPQEAEEDFDELIQFVQDIRFERMGAFVYSHESGTYAYEQYEDHIPLAVKQDRMDRLMQTQEQIAGELNTAKVGKTLRTLIDRAEEEYFVGRTEYDSPEVDGEVLIARPLTHIAMLQEELWSIRLAVSSSTANDFPSALGDTLFTDRATTTYGCGDRFPPHRSL